MSDKIKLKREPSSPSSLGTTQHPMLGKTRVGFDVRRDELLSKQNSVTFKKVWEKTSKKAITYDRSVALWPCQVVLPHLSNHIYFDNYHTCYSVIGSKPHLLYKLPSCSPQERIEDALICECPVEEVNPSDPHSHKSHMLVLTKNNWIAKIDLESGKILQRVFLSDRHKFRHLNWNTVGYSITVKSILSRGLIRENDPATPSLVVAVFELFPFRLYACLEITKQAFKKSITDAVVDQGLLIVMHPGNLVRIFSFERIVQENTVLVTQLGQKHPTLDGLVGEYPVGIPTTTQVQELPGILFELRCHQHSLWIGGEPWMYFYQPKNMEVRRLCCFHNMSVIKNGEIEMSSLELEMEAVYFLSDDSNRVVHIRTNDAVVLKISTDDDGLTRLDPAFTIHPHGDGPHQDLKVKGHLISPGGDNEDTQTWTVTSSGRIVRKRVNLEDCGVSSSRIFSLTYEDQLDLLISTSVSASQFCSSVEAHVCYHDSYTGRVMRAVKLEEGWDDTFSHTVVADLDLLIHIYVTSDKHHCVIYRLNRSIDNDAPVRHRRKKSRILDSDNG